MASRIPRPNAPLIDKSGAPTHEWYNWLSVLGDLFETSDAGLQQQITAIAYILGSPDGTVANIPPITGEFLPKSTQVIGQNSVQSIGALADGVVFVQLDGDEATPGPSHYYGTDELGSRGFHPFPEPPDTQVFNRITAGGDVRVTADGDLRITD